MLPFNKDDSNKPSAMSGARTEAASDRQPSIIAAIII